MKAMIAQVGLGLACTGLMPTFITCFPPPAPPNQKKKLLHFRLSLEKGEETSLKLQRKERSAV